VRLLTLVAVIALVSSGCIWPQFRFDASHSGSNPLETVLSPANVGSLTRKWSVTTPHGATSSPAVGLGVVYEGGSGLVDGAVRGEVYALNTATGQVIWNTVTDGPVISSPAVANGVVYIGGGYDVKVYALNATTGQVLWTVTTSGNVISSPAVANGVVYVTSEDGKV